MGARGHGFTRKCQGIPGLGQREAPTSVWVGAGVRVLHQIISKCVMILLQSADMGMSQIGRSTLPSALQRRHLCG